MSRNVLLLLDGVDASLDSLGVVLAGAKEDVADLAGGSVTAQAVAR